MKPRDILSSKFVTDYTGPVFVTNLDVVRQKIELFRTALPRVELNYAVKANPHPAILKAVIENGGSFDIASLQEAVDVLDLGADSSSIVYSNPVRPASYLKDSSDLGIRWFVVDNMHELLKVAKHVDNPQIYIRLAVPNTHAAYSLAGKFGATLEEAEKLVDYCVSHELSLRGVSFHPGSQNLSGEAWTAGIRMAKQLFHYMMYKGLTPDFLNLGGGFPATYMKQLADFVEYCEPIRRELQDLPDSFRIIAEPGRYICAETMQLLCRVISTTIRDNQLWVYLDAGVFHGIFEASTDFEFRTEATSTKPRVSYTIAGPTCDSMDIVSKKAYLPHNLVDGDFIVFQNLGAYSTAYATDFNGFPKPKVIILEREHHD